MGYHDAVDLNKLKDCDTGEYPDCFNHMELPLMDLGTIGWPDVSFWCCVIVVFGFLFCFYS